MPNILVCDDERSLCQVLEIDLRKQGYKVETVNSRDEAKRKIDGALYDVIITDIRMPSTDDGMDVMMHARKVSPDSAVILMTAQAGIETAIQAVRAGAFDYVEKHPRVIDEIRIAASRAVETVALRRQNRVFKRDAASRATPEHILGASPAVELLKQTIRTVAPTGSTIAIRGESGTGKELVARAIHACSPRVDEPFVSINCGAFPETLLESELFGYMKGAFTGATQNKQGLFELANNGTIFLDEIGEMTLSMQVKLLRVLQERTVRPLGGTGEVPVDVRVIAATNRDLQKMVAESSFREDLYYRISVIPIEVPPLRDRREDIPVLATHFLRKYAAAAGKSIERIDKESMNALLSFDWPGNIRQLENAIEHAVAVESSDTLHVALPAARLVGGSSPLTIPSAGVDLEKQVAEMERSYLVAALQQAGGVQTKAADMLKLSYRSFRHLIKKYSI